jgi:protein SCO1/2
MPLKNRLLRTAILALVGIAIGGLIALYQINQEQGAATVIVQGEGIAIEPMTGVQLGGDFTLIDHNGNTVTQADYADRFKLIYFGFTYCPAICPTELQKMAQVVNALPEDISAQIAQLFITVDPERDTVEVMQDYVSLFHSQLIGLTGSEEQINAVKSAYKVFATKVEDETLNDYTVDHSSFIYLMSKDNQALMIFRMQDDKEMMTEAIARIVGAQSD